MQNLGKFRYLQPSFFAGLLDDPVLYIQVRPTGRGLLFDCGSAGNNRRSMRCVRIQEQPG